MTAEQLAAALNTLPAERLLEVAALLIDTRDALREAYGPDLRRSMDRPAIAHRRYLLVSALARLDVFLAEQVARAAEGQRQEAGEAQRALFEAGA